MSIRYRFLLPVSFMLLYVISSCSQDNSTKEHNNTEKLQIETNSKNQEPHKYGGWYCPDNLNGFPAVDIETWKNVPVVNGRMATREETQNGTSLIYVDLEKYPNAKPLDMEMPRLARFYNEYSRKNELVIVIQALNISNDSIVGFRYLNGGNGSARLNEVKFLTDQDIEKISSSRFVALDVEINATKKQVWDVLTKPAYTQALKAIFDKENTFMPRSDDGDRVNFAYAKGGPITSDYAGELFGNQYIQVDCEHEDYQYVQKFLVSENQAGNSVLQIVCGPYEEDFNDQNSILKEWAQKVKILSEEL